MRHLPSPCWVAVHFISQTSGLGFSGIRPQVCSLSQELRASLWKGAAPTVGFVNSCHEGRSRVGKQPVMCGHTVLTHGGAWNFEPLKRWASAHCLVASRSFVLALACPSCEWLTSLGREDSQNKAEGLGFLLGVASPLLTRGEKQITVVGRTSQLQVWATG